MNTLYLREETHMSVIEKYDYRIPVKCNIVKWLKEDLIKQCDLTEKQIKHFENVLLKKSYNELTLLSNQVSLWGWGLLISPILQDKH